MNRILITGGLGYVGGRVAQALAKSSGVYLLLGTRQKSLKTPEWLIQGKIIHLDVLSDESVQAACRNVKTVIHLAAVNELDSVKDPENALMINTLGTLKLLRAAEKTGVERFVYFSTARVYGDTLSGVITENTPPRPSHPYAITHHAAEDFVLAAHHQKKLTGIVFRLSNGFGAPVRPQVNRWTLLVNDLCRQVVTTRRLVLRSSGLQWRDFITLSDVCRVVQHVLKLPASSCHDGLFNLGGDCALRIIDVVEMIVERCSKMMGFIPDVIRSEPDETERFEPLRYCVDKLKKTGFKLEGNMKKEIDDTLRLCQSAFCP